MRRVIAVPVIALLTSATSALANPPHPKKPPPKTTVLAMEIKDVLYFFAGFTGRSKLPPKSQFETEAEYLKRLQRTQPAWNSGVLVYFRVGEEYDDHKLVGKGIGFSYDIEHERLRLIAGHPALGWSQEDERIYGDPERSYVPLVIATQSEPQRSYTGKNAFGVSKTITKVWHSEYVLHLVNFNASAPLYEWDKGSLGLDLSMPRDAAKHLSTNAEILIGVKLLGFQNSSFTCEDTHEPTIDEPYEISRFKYSIDAILTSVLVRDRSTGEIVKTIDYVDLIGRAAKAKAVQVKAASDKEAALEQKPQSDPENYKKYETTVKAWTIYGCEVSDLIPPAGQPIEHLSENVEVVATGEMASSDAIYCKVTLSDGRSGWCLKNELSFTPRGNALTAKNEIDSDPPSYKSYPSPKSAHTLRISTVYRTAYLRGDPVGPLPADRPVKVLGQAEEPNTVYKVELVNGKQGWLDGNDVMFDPADVKNTPSIGDSGH